MARSDADHSLPSSAEVRNAGAIPPLPDNSSSRDAQLSTGEFLLVLLYSQGK
jgi:hypothetical protein